MNRLLLILPFLLTTCHFSPAPAADPVVKDNPDGSRTITIDADMARLCDRKGGCMLAPIETMREAVRLLIQHQCGKEV